MKWEVLTTGYCTHPEFLVFRGGAFAKIRFPATVLYGKHPKHGHILYDTGYSAGFFSATKRFPEKLYALVTPVHLRPEETAAYQLAQRGVHASDVNVVIISHFHGDHISGIADFPAAKYFFLAEGYRRVLPWSRFKQIRQGFLKDLLPADFTTRARGIETSSPHGLLPEFDAFPTYDIFGDGSLVGVSLPGHAPGQMGLWLNDNGQKKFFVADACWSAAQYQTHRAVNPLAYAVMENRAQYDATVRALQHLHRQHPEVAIVPCHCQKSHTALTCPHHGELQ